MNHRTNALWKSCLDSGREFEHRLLLWSTQFISHQSSSWHCTNTHHNEVGFRFTILPIDTLSRYNSTCVYSISAYKPGSRSHDFGRRVQFNLTKGKQVGLFHSLDTRPFPKPYPFNYSHHNPQIPFETLAGGRCFP